MRELRLETGEVLRANFVRDNRLASASYLRIYDGEPPRICTYKEFSKADLERVFRHFAPELHAWAGKLPTESGRIPAQLCMFGERIPLATGVPGTLRTRAKLVDGTLVTAAQERCAVQRAVEVWAIERLRELIDERLATLAPKLVCPWMKIQISSGVRYWGRCTSAGTLRFSKHLAILDPELIGYVVAHECAHLTQLHHKPAFWAELERLMPDWREAHERVRAERMHPWFMA